MATDTRIIASNSVQNNLFVSSLANITSAITPLVREFGEKAFLAGAATAIGLESIRALISATNENALDLVGGECPPVADSTCNSVIYYDAGCEALKHDFYRLGHQIFKKGVHFGQTPWKRVDQLGPIHYAGFFRDPAQPQNFIAAGAYDKWRMATNRSEDFDTIILPPEVRIHGDAYLIVLPPGVSGADFDQMVTGLMLPRELGTWIFSTEGRALCAARNLDPNEFVRYWRDPLTGSYHRAVELYAYHPKRDRRWFVGVLAQALAHVKGQATH